jgi:tRNA wybutosine-synthesizing protein 1
MQVDEPQLLLDGFEEGHRALIKAMRGVPGVRPERFAEAQKQIRHCALSLVGEPIIYPQINAFLDLLHGRGISSFMVTNAQRSMPCHAICHSAGPSSYGR